MVCFVRLISSKVPRACVFRAGRGPAWGDPDANGTVCFVCLVLFCDQGSCVRQSYDVEHPQEASAGVAPPSSNARGSRESNAGVLTVGQASRVRGSAVAEGTCCNI